MSSPPLRLALLSVNVGTPRVIGTRAGAPVLSGIGKHPSVGAALTLSPTGLEGDQQADLTVHGGRDKAVYAYPSDHWPFWTGEMGLACGPGTFGENLTLAGGTEDDVHIGDLFAWGDALLEVSQPRQPCYKLGLHLNRADIAPAMVKTGRCGWYLRVARPASVAPREATLVRTDRAERAPTVRAVFRAQFDPKLSAARLVELAETPALAEVWRVEFLSRAAARHAGREGQ